MITVEASKEHTLIFRRGQTRLFANKPAEFNVILDAELAGNPVEIQWNGEKFKAAITDVLISFDEGQCVLDLSFEQIPYSSRS